jgi:hypothetical protein
VDADSGVFANEPYIEIFFLRNKLYIRVYVPSVPLSRSVYFFPYYKFNIMKRIEMLKLENTSGGACTLTQANGAAVGCAIIGLTAGIFSGGAGFFAGLACSIAANNYCNK